MAMKDMSPQHEPKPALWKSLIIGAMVLLVITGWVVVLFNLPIVTGDAPQ